MSSVFVFPPLLPSLCIAGAGKYTFAAGGEFEGVYSDDKKAGQGIFTYPDGGVYEGANPHKKYIAYGSYIPTLNPKPKP